jgi:hypothetical protein
MQTSVAGLRIIIVTRVKRSLMIAEVFLRAGTVIFGGARHAGKYLAVGISNLDSDTVLIL